MKREQLIKNLVNKVTDKLAEASGNDQVVEISSLYRYLTTDVIAEYSFGYSMNLLEHVDKGERLFAIWRSRWRRLARFNTYGLRVFIIPWLEYLVKKSPSWMFKQDDVSMRGFVEYRQVQ